ncbi:WS/DGAT/MGAT family O-acyltransferase [Actinomadura sp. HBU206391]|uniref:WS/DGAT/MGAT family O-acyltransferase n=1 Tax=Actinomadura sp. HBU206391 TaxID=2731692 RepID=UPI001650B211|nr:wax ester/triacylglycerol synthase family O-acyltransferase [Actinomadura sp. HBU206391]MBC6463024.1 wax ester/triacylglycerol synthase family O-acyltransferase [Actinomadura sp. HBU206391]
MERMNALDAGFLFAERENTPLHIGSVTVFEGPAPAYGDLIRMILGKLADVPRYRQRVRTVPLNLGRPVWVDDPHFQILYHVRHTAVPAPGGAEELRNLAGRVLAQSLDLSKPLWELWLVEGLESGGWALIAKVHHCVVDGVGAGDLMTLLFDLAPDADRPGSPEPWTAEAAPSTLSLVVGGLRDTVTEPVRRWTGAAALGRRVCDIRGVWEFVGGLPRSLRPVADPAARSLSGPIGPHRRWSWMEAELDDVKAIRRAFGGTVNDVLLAAVARGLRDVLETRGELSEQTRVRSLVPVSVRGDDEHAMLSNRVSGVIVTLPCGEPDPLERLRLIREQMDGLKRTHQAMGADALVRLAGYAPTLLSLASRAVLAAVRPLFQTVTTNVPGPPFPLYVMGRKVVRLYPYVPIAAGVAVSTGIFSYAGRLYFGVTGDFDSMPDLDVLTAGVQAGIAELLDGARAV